MEYTEYTEYYFSELATKPLSFINNKTYDECISRWGEQREKIQNFLYTLRDEGYLDKFLEMTNDKQDFTIKLELICVEGEEKREIKQKENEKYMKEIDEEYEKREKTGKTSPKLQEFIDDVEKLIKEEKEDKRIRGW